MSGSSTRCGPLAECLDQPLHAHSNNNTCRWFC